MARSSHSQHQRASSVPSSPKLFTGLTRNSSAIRAPSTPPPPFFHSVEAHLAPRSPSSSASSASVAAIQSSLLHPRLAVLLNVPPPWHPWLFALRLVSILPAIWWGIPSIFRLLLPLLELILVAATGRHLAAASEHDEPSQTETALAVIWCFASGYLSFFFTDCLMSRWLLNYTPQATVVRLLSINAVNAYVTLTVLSLAGGFRDSRLLLPGWIGIATTLTVCYHITHQKINIRKETSTSLNVFSIASYISMLTLLIHIHINQRDYPDMPLAVWARDTWRDARQMGSRIAAAMEHREL